MEKKFFPNRALFWSFVANILFIFGMIGYLLMDTFDYKHLNRLNLFMTNMIYVFLASLFVICATLQFFVIYYTNKNIQRYYTMILSCIIDKIACHAYLLGAILTVVSVQRKEAIWTFNIIGVYGFVIGAAINLMIPGTTSLSLWADYFNLLGALFYLIATIITRLPFTQLLALCGDTIYLIDSILYMICWFQDRQLAIKQYDQYQLFT